MTGHAARRQPSNPDVLFADAGKNLGARLPQFSQIDEISKTPIAGIFEVPRLPIQIANWMSAFLWSFVWLAPTAGLLTFITG